MFDQKNYEEFYVNVTGLHFFIGRGKGRARAETSHLHVKIWCYFELKPKGHIFVILSFFLGFKGFTKNS